jgi:hypothetical protein
MTPEK